MSPPCMRLVERLVERSKKEVLQIQQCAPSSASSLHACDFSARASSSHTCVARPDSQTDDQNLTDKCVHRIPAGARPKNMCRKKQRTNPADTAVCMTNSASRASSSHARDLSARTSSLHTAVDCIVSLDSRIDD
eukprot:gnl/MRDRNA2_/MRDRNA2_85543_c0_seq1.p2 gnl/MRDRNA2_/MRDRNA2_85543_c0~~gnl/MRDRNA2_/MRDRNA2_85543_c0_seq1.p2  ORF type:complete len:134 (+),score=16.47 gnl/MRDRNA2_/MRDRNA2_85543_c0_seq1:509-910(+)